MKNIKYAILFIILPLFSAMPQQITIPEVERMPNLPQPYNMPDWRNIALGYDSLAFDLNAAGTHLPLISIYNSTVNYPAHPSFRLHTVVGTPHPNSSEAINAIPAVISASLNGIDKTNQNGHNWVLMSEEWFNNRKEMNVYKNHPVSDQSDDWWYESMPNVFFYQLYDLYPGTGNFEAQFKIVADRFLEVVRLSGGSAAPWAVPDMNYRGWDFIKMEPHTEGVKEPEAAGAIAWLLYNAYLKTGEIKYRSGAEQCLEFLNSLTVNPSYEIQLPYGAFTAARMNAEAGTNYDISKLVKWCFSPGPLRNWGTTTGRWGVYDVYGLVGEISPREYAFSMNTFQHIGALVPLVRYDKRFARAIGKWVLNAANASRLFYTKYLPDGDQDSEEWAKQYDPNSYLAHEALLKKNNWPYATGDAIAGGWGATNLTLYSSSHAGIMGGIIKTTNVEKILQLDLLKTNYFKDEAYPTYLYFNPYGETQTVEIDAGPQAADLYEAISGTIIKSNVSGKTSVDIAADAAVIITLIPAGMPPVTEGKLTKAGGVIINYDNGSQSNNAPRIKGLETESDTLIINQKTQVYCTVEDLDGDGISYTWTASGGVIEGAGSSVIFTAGASAAAAEINVTVSDGKGGSASETITVTVLEKIISPPVISKIKAEPRKLPPGGLSTITCFASDQSADVLGYEWTVSGGSLSGSGSSVQWQAPDAEGDYLITCTVTDADGGTDEADLSLMVRVISAASGEMIVYLPFEGNSSDASGFGNNAVNSGADYVSDRFGAAGKALSFDGISDNLRITNKPQLNFQTGATVNFWMYAPEYLAKEEFIISHGSWENRWKISIFGERLRWTLKTANGTKDLDTETLLKEDSLFNITCTYNGKDMEIYINGELDAFTGWTGAINTTTLDLTIAQRLPTDNNYNYKGVLDDVRIYNYQLSQEEISSFYDIVSVEEEENKTVVTEYMLEPNYPNPFNNSTVIKFSLPKEEHVTLEVYNVLGEREAVLLNEIKNPGVHEAAFNSGLLASGVYFCRIITGGYTAVIKMILNK